MAEQNDPVMAEVMNLLEAEPTSSPDAPGLDIPAHREELAILVSSGRCKEAIGTQLTHDQVKRMPDKDVMRAHKRHVAYVGAKTSESLINNFVSFSEKVFDFATKAFGFATKIKDTDALQKDLKNNYIVMKEMSDVSGFLALKYGRSLAGLNAVMITANHVDFSAEDSKPSHPSRDSDGYPLAGLDEVDKAEEYSVTPQ